MDFLTVMFDFFWNILNGVGQLATWLTTSHSFMGGMYSINPLAFLTIGGLVTYLGVAVVKWLMI